jgi:phenylalanine-4-hydroxylase
MFILEANNELQSDHIGFHDPVYRQRRNQIVESTQNYDPTLKNFPEIEYLPTEIQTWNTLFTHLEKVYPEVACEEYLKNFNLLVSEKIFVPDQIPDLKTVSNFIQSRTGFQLYPVSGLLSPKQFLRGLGDQTFYCTQYIRHHCQPFYTPEPDIVHEMLGHVPMFLDRDICEISKMIGEVANICSEKKLKDLERLYWFTIEFGVMSKGKKIYGAGILSSMSEIERIQTASIRPFDLNEILDDNPLITEMQRHYYSINSFDDLKKIIRVYLSHYF